MNDIINEVGKLRKDVDFLKQEVKSLKSMLNYSRKLSRPKPNPFDGPSDCPKCGKPMISIPRLGISHACDALLKED